MQGSDHCPVYVDFKNEVVIDGRLTHIVDIMNPPGRFLNGVSSREYDSKDALSLSARRLPEFAKRRNIREMFQHGISSSSRPKPESSEDKSPSKGANQAASFISTPPKRPRGGSSPSANKTLKRSKSNASQTVAQPSGGQTSLAGFFKPKISTNATAAKSQAIEASLSNTELPPASSGLTTTNTQIESPRQVHDLFDAEALSTQQSQSIDSGPLDQQKLGHTESSLSRELPDTKTEPPVEPHDVFESKVSWSRLFTKPQPPRCQGHDEPCVSMTSKKKGGNQGRSFWMCRRPLGPSGEKERGTEWRCGSFIWCSDWRQPPS